MVLISSPEWGTGAFHFLPMSESCHLLTYFLGTFSLVQKTMLRLIYMTYANNTSKIHNISTNKKSKKVKQLNDVWLTNI